MNKRRGGKYDGGTAERKQSRGSIDEKLDAFVQLNPKVDYDITNGSTSWIRKAGGFGKRVLRRTEAKKCRSGIAGF